MTTKHRSPWSAKEDSLLGTASDAEIAERLGRTTRAVEARRERLGIKAQHRIGKVWPARVLALLGKVPDTEIAAMMDVWSLTVLKKRRSLGIPSYQSKQRKRVK